MANPYTSSWNKNTVLLFVKKKTKTSDPFSEGDTANVVVEDRVADVLGAVVSWLVESDAVIASSEEVEIGADEQVPKVSLSEGIIEGIRPNLL